MVAFSFDPAWIGAFLTVAPGVTLGIAIIVCVVVALVGRTSGTVPGPGAAQSEKRSSTML